MYGFTTRLHRAFSRDLLHRSISGAASGAPTLVALGLAAFCTAIPASAQVTISQNGRFDAGRAVGIDPKLNAQIPLDTIFRDETGKTVRLGDYFGQKPVIMNMIFYKCAGSCVTEEEDMLKAFQQIDFNIGGQFNVVTVSIHPKETPALAAEKKETFVAAYGRPSVAAGWHFLVGDLDQLQKLTTAVGFRYVYAPKLDQVAHSTGIMVCTPQGRISQYFIGTQYPPRDVRLALVQASANKIGSVVDHLVLFCSQFDATTGRYGLLINRIILIACVLTVLILATSIIVMSRRYRRVPLKPTDRSAAST